MRRRWWVFVWVIASAAGAGLFIYNLGLDRSDKLSSVGSFVLTLGSIVAAVRAYLAGDRSPIPPTPRSTPTPVPKYVVNNNGGGPNFNLDENGTVNINYGATGHDKKRKD